MGRTVLWILVSILGAVQVTPQSFSIFPGDLQVEEGGTVEENLQQICLDSTPNH